MYEYLTVEEFSAGFENLTEPEKKKIILVSNILCSKYRLHRLGIDSHELLTEAFQRFLSGTRNLPNDVDFVNAFTYALGSIAEGMANRKKDLLLSNPINDQIEESELDPSFEDVVIENEGLIERESELKEVFIFFKNDEDIILLLKAKLEEMKPNEIVENYFNGNKTQYETTNRRYRRGITKFLSLRNTDE